MGIHRRKWVFESWNYPKLLWPVNHLPSHISRQQCNCCNCATIVLQIERQLCYKCMQFATNRELSTYWSWNTSEPLLITSKPLTRVKWWFDTRENSLYYEKIARFLFTYIVISLGICVGVDSQSVRLRGEEGIDHSLDDMTVLVWIYTKDSKYDVLVHATWSASVSLLDWLSETWITGTYIQ